MVLRCECCENDFSGVLGSFGCQRLSPDDRAHEERSEQQVVDEVQVGVGVELAAFDAALEDLGHGSAAWYAGVGSLANAQSSEVQAVAEYQIAQVDIAQATGTVLGASRVTWQPPAAPKK